MSTKDWYQYILKYKVFNNEINGSTIKVLCRIERNRPEWNFPEVWSFVRMASLPSQTTTFLWRLAHELIPSEGRLGACNYGGNTSPFCRKACTGEIKADYEHVFFRCIHSKEIGDWLLNKIRTYSSANATPESILNFEHLENKALSWITAKTLQYIWDGRMGSERKASLEGLLSLMRRNLEDLENTKFHNIFEVGNPMISTVPVPFNNSS